MPVNLPAGWDFDKVFGEQAAKTRAANFSSPAARTRQIALMAAAPPPSPSPAAAAPGGRLAPVRGANGINLPDTATSADKLIIAGMAALLLAGLLALLLVFLQGRVRDLHFDGERR